MEQLATLGKQADVDTLPIVAGQTAPDIARRAMNAGRLGGYDVVILDTAGRITLDEAMMSEAAEISRISSPAETLLVADSLTGQDAVRTAKAFNDRLRLTGLVLTRADGDSRGGAALSMRAVTGLPIKFLGSGEKIDQLDAFDARRVAGRILGQGDVVALVEKAAGRLRPGRGGEDGPKARQGPVRPRGPRQPAAPASEDGRHAGHHGPPARGAEGQEAARRAVRRRQDAEAQEAIIGAMTPAERKKPDILNASRKRRIAKGAGVEVAELNRLLKQHRQMADMFKSMGKGGGKGFAQMAQAMGMGGPGGIPGLPSGGGMGGGADLARLKALGGRQAVGSRSHPAGPRRTSRTGGAAGSRRLPRHQETLRTEPYAQDSSRPRRRQEAPVLSDRRRRQPLAPRRPLHRARRQLQPAAGQGQPGPHQAERRKHPGLAVQGRAADRPRGPLPVDRGAGAMAAGNNPDKGAPARRPRSARPSAPSATPTAPKAKPPPAPRPPPPPAGA
jgi:hypothetical protein